jgi:twitching motility protein PilT
MSVIQTNRKAGMITMDEALTQLYYSGRIAKDSAIEFAQDVEGMEIKLG